MICYGLLHSMYRFSGVEWSVVAIPIVLDEINWLQKPSYHYTFLQ